MRKYITLVGIIAAFAAMLSGCAKTTDPINPNVATITFVKAGPKFLTSDITVNPKDSIQFQYTVTSSVPMATVELDKSLVSSNNVLPAFAFKDSVKTAGALTFTVTHKMIADSIPAIYQYNVVARDRNGVFVGQSVVINVTVTSDFYYYPNRTIFTPDTAQTAQTYYSSSLNNTFSYATGAANSANIDFGYYFNPDTSQKAGSKANQPVYGHFLYALNATPTPRSAKNPVYDISTWTKNATIMKQVTASVPTFASLTSGGAIKQGALTNLKTGATTQAPVVTTTITAGKQTDTYTPLATGNVIWFKTADGRYGALTVTFLSSSTSAKTTYMNYEVKITK